MPAETLNNAAPPDTEVVSEDQELEMSITGVGLLNDIDRYLRRYLECSDHQRAVMAFWVLHTFCLSIGPDQQVSGLNSQSVVETMLSTVSDRTARIGNSLGDSALVQRLKVEDPGVPWAKGRELEQLVAAPVTHPAQSEIANNDAGCHAVTHAHAVPPGLSMTRV